MIDSALAHLDRSFTYLIPDDLTVEVGSIVRVPFRRAKARGVVVALLATPDIDNAKAITETFGPSIGEDLASIAVWLSGRTLSTHGEALAAIVPARVAAVEAEKKAVESLPERDPVVVPTGLADAVTGGKGAVWRPERGLDRGPIVAELVARTLDAGRTAIVCIPEVGGGPVLRALRAAFGAALADLSSERGARARYADWLAAREGRKRVVVGGRSAVFAPVSDLGLIVLDDESHAAHKEGRAPRYHARSVASERARRSGAACVLIGMPPSVEASAAARKAFTSVVPAKADERAGRIPVTVIETRQRLVPQATTLREITDAITANGRVVLLSHRLPLDEVAARTVRITGPQSVAVLDAKTPAREIARALRSAQLVIASPVIAREGAAADTAIVVICDADAALARPEFRASEETFSTWWRLCANLRPGARILIETAHPKHPAIEALVHADPDRLVRAESTTRKDLGYPPFGALARIDVPSSRAKEVAAAVTAAGGGLDVLGPVAEGDRAVIAVRAATREALLTALGPLASAWRAASEPMRIDVDPWEVFVPRWRSSKS